MRIAICNIQMHARTGTEIVTRDLALGLKRRGHDVEVLTGSEGGLTNELRQAGVGIHMDAATTAKPQVIHINHMGFAAPLMQLHPDAPVLVQCHDATHGNAALHASRQVKVWSGVSQACIERVSQEIGIPPDSVRFLPNCVDLDLLPPAGKPVRLFPRRWLFVCEKPDSVLLLPQLLRTAACFAAALELTGPFAPSPRTVGNLPAHAAGYDLVFASARCAIECAAAGAGVIVLDPRGLGGFLGPDEWPAWSRHNLGLGCLNLNPTTANLVRAVLSWRPSKVRQASLAIRRERSLSGLLDALETLYRSMAAGAP